MATVHLQKDHCRLTGAERVLEIDATTVGALIDELDRRYPGLGPLLRDGSSVSINGELIANGIYEKVDADTEVHFIAIVSGG